MICTAGIWTVKEGREEEFSRRWEESVDALVLDYPDLTFRLLRDRENPRRFLSLGDGWRTAGGNFGASYPPGWIKTDDGRPRH
ncbi:MAG: hypothetical protein E6G28_08315 [Actinobacteria bacterium]|nr:MAG: hypothetical protein E6G28_08315 [Actinomycetota bacterium]